MDKLLAPELIACGWGRYLEDMSDDVLIFCSESARLGVLGLAREEGRGEGGGLRHEGLGLGAIWQCFHRQYTYLAVQAVYELATDGELVWGSCWLCWGHSCLNESDLCGADICLAHI